MQNLSPIDYSVIAVYMAILIGIGFFLKNRAGASLEDYFLGGRKLPWWALGISGMASFLDITGTMVIVSFLYMLGPRGLFVEFRGGATIVLVFMLLWTGKWHRRSGCITGAEWMAFRFGEGLGAQFARIVMAIGVMAGTIGMLAYLCKGVGLFLSMFIDLSPFYCALLMITVATLYTVVSGFYGVVFTDIFQSGIILIAVITISIMAAIKVAGSDNFGQLVHQATGSTDWMTAYPQWKTTMPVGGEYNQFKFLWLVTFFYLVRNVFGGLASGADPKYFGARSDRECGLLTFLWTWLMMFRWPMMMGFAVLGIYLVHDLFPDTSVLAEAATLIKHYVPTLTDKAQWGDLIAGIRLNPDLYPHQLIDGLHTLLGVDWSHKLNLVGFEGQVDPERILPAVILFDIPLGFRGLILVALIAASMSTFDSTVNAAAGYFTRDIYQRYLRPQAPNRELMTATWIFIVAIVALGFAFGYLAKSINEIWDWIVMGLGGGLLVPSVLRLYWWRFNGSGFAIGTVVGLAAAILQKAFMPGLNGWNTFLLMVAIGMTASIIGTYLTGPTDPKVLEHFYHITRPFGLWGPLKHSLPPEQRKAVSREHFFDIISTPFVFTWQISLFLLPMLLVVADYRGAAITAAFFSVSLVVMYFTWYRQLPHDEPISHKPHASTSDPSASAPL